MKGSMNNEADRAKIAAALVKGRREAEQQDRAAPERVRKAVQKWEAENRPSGHGVFVHARKQWTEMDGDRALFVEGTVTEFHRNAEGLAALAAATAEIEQRVGANALAAWDAVNGADWEELAPERAAIAAAEEAAEAAKWTAIELRRELRHRLNYAEPAIKRVLSELGIHSAWLSKKEDRLVLSASLEDAMRGNHIGEFVVTPEGDCPHWEERAAKWAKALMA